MTAATFAGVLTLGMSYPFEVIQTRIHADTTLKTKQRTLTTTFDVFNDLMINGGRNQVYKGFYIASIQMLP